MPAVLKGPGQVLPGHKPLAVIERPSEVLPPEAHTEASPAGLREVLFKALDDLRSGRIDARKAVAIAVLSREIVSVLRLEARGGA